jgi:diguanylate cyclase (GGDEF)-like protein
VLTVLPDVRMSSKLLQIITLGEAERALAQPRHVLQFPPHIEARFERDTGAARSRHLVITVLIGIAVYDGFLISDYRMLPDVFLGLLVLKLALVTPAALAGVLVFLCNPAALLRESLLALLAFAVVTSALYVVLRSESPAAAHAHYALIVGVMFVNVVIRLRFWHAVMTSLAVLIVYAATLLGFQGLPSDAYWGAVFMMASIVLCTLIANYSLERDERRAYLFRLRDTIRNEYLIVANRELDRISNVDAMTGVANRRGFDHHVKAMWAQAAYSGQSVAVLMLDVDLFKRFNDRYGHQAGDACLQTVAAAARGQLRRRDELIARFGGEEFVAVLLGADLGGGLRAAERIRRAIESRQIEHECAPAKIVTVSIGVAAAFATADGSPDEIIKAADAALYEAKNRGRNRVWPPIEMGDAEPPAPTLVPSSTMPDVTAAE